MRRYLIAVAVLIAVAACNSTLVPTAAPSPTATPVASPTLAPATATTPNPAASTTPNPSAAGAVITEQVGDLRATHPVAWRVVAGPVAVANRPVPLFYLSDAPLTVGLCPTPDPKTGEFKACPQPLSVLPAGGVLMAFSPNVGVLEVIPPRISLGSPEPPCRAVGGDAQMHSVAAGTVVSACLRGPDLTSHEAQVRAVIASLRRSS
jgi:hypothetical protein